MIQLTNVRNEYISETVRILQRLSDSKVESVVLWLAARKNSTAEVQTVFVPQQETGFDYFIIPPAGVREVLAKCRTERVFVAAQLHTHPFQAFHSEADDDLALIRHENALSFVFPDFASSARLETFSSNVELFRLSGANKWEFVPKDEHCCCYRIT